MQVHSIYLINMQQVTRQAKEYIRYVGNTLGMDGAGRGNIGSCESFAAAAGDGGNSDEDTLTTSTSLWAVCEGWDEDTMVSSGWKNWPGVTNGGIAPSGKTEPDVLAMDDTDSDVSGITAVGPVLGLSEAGNRMLVLSKAGVSGETKGKLVLDAAVGRVWGEALLRIKLEDDSETVAEDLEGNIEDCKSPRVPIVGAGDWEESIGECKFGVPVPKGGKKAEGDSDGLEVEGPEDPADNDAFMVGYSIGCCIEGGIDKPGEGISNDCCWCWNPFEGPENPCQYIAMGIPLPFVVGGAEEPQDPRLPRGWYIGRVLWNGGLGSPICGV